MANDPSPMLEIVQTDCLRLLKWPMLGSRIEGKHNCDATGETVGLLARAIALLRRRARVARLLRTGRESPGYRVPARKEAFEATRSAPLVPVHFGGLV